MYTTQEYQEQHDKLVAASFTEQQARTIMQHVESQQVKMLDSLATKRQLAEVRSELKQDIADVHKDLNHRMTVGFVVLFFMSMIGPNLPSIVSFFVSLFK